MITEGTLLGGRVRYRQFAAGHRSGFEPVLLAAAVPARPGETVLEAGSGAGAGLLCLAARVPGLLGHGLEIDPALAALANENFQLNDFQALGCVTGDAASPPALPACHHIFANPPWHHSAATRSPDRGRALAHHAPPDLPVPDLLAAWLAGLRRCLKPRGSLTLILPAAALSDAVCALKAHGFGAVALLPLWPRQGQPARQFIIAARAGARGPDKILPGLVLHDEAGISAAADEILRGGAALAMV